MLVRVYYARIYTKLFLQDVDAALEVFTNHASVSDYHLRKQLMTSLVSMCASDHYIAGVANAWCKRLQECSTTKALVKIERGNLAYGNQPLRISICFICFLQMFLTLCPFPTLS